MTVLVVAALSARLLAEAARAAGFEVVALDLFGDVDTRRAARTWRCIGNAHRLAIEAGPLAVALAEVCAEHRPVAMVAGSGFEADPELLSLATLWLPLWGNVAQTWRRVGDPTIFFRALDAQGIAHPRVSIAPPIDPVGWLSKSSGGCGGWHIARLGPHGDDVGTPDRYYQREARGLPMSATFIANGRQGLVLGFNRQTVRSLGAHPFVFCGVIGPVPVSARIARQATQAVQALVERFELRGLGSLDFLQDTQGDCQVLEVNPRPSASMALHGEAVGHGGEALLMAHVRACTEARLPTVRIAAAGPVGSLGSLGSLESVHWAPQVQGMETVFAGRSMMLDEPTADALAARVDCHDLPSAGQRFDLLDPVCTVSARAQDAGAVQALLARACQDVQRLLEPCS